MPRLSPNASLPVDVDARELRERLELAVARGHVDAVAEAATELVKFTWAHPEYQLLKLVASEFSDTAAKKIESQYAGRCSECQSRYSPGDLIYWTPGQRAKCVGCGGKP